VSVIWSLMILCFCANIFLPLFVVLLFAFHDNLLSGAYSKNVAKKKEI
jgi:hypothetical protein